MILCMDIPLCRRLWKSKFLKPLCHILLFLQAGVPHPKIESATPEQALIHPSALPAQLRHKQHSGCSPNSDCCQNPSELKCWWHMVSHLDPTVRHANLGTKISQSQSPCSPLRGLTSPKCHISAPSKIFYSSEVQREQWNSHLLMLSSPTGLQVGAGGP